MPTYARGQIVLEDEVGVYHCIARCVRRAFLCGVDPYTGQDYSHRKEWILDRMRELRDEKIARAANHEDGSSGRFWAGRFKSVALLDEAAILACGVYVDLNPIRAGIATTPGWKRCVASVDCSSRRRADRARSSMPRRAARAAGSRARRRLEPPLCRPLARRPAINRHLHEAFTPRAWPPRALDSLPGAVSTGRTV